ncbi:MAG: preprotein translocase subunit SecA [Chloroflexi bacterium]|nr:preprotein translocase subunit SecA [Chloroflexota bacterium]
MLKFLLGDSNEKELRKLQPFVDRVNELTAEIEALSDAQLRAKTDEFRSRLEADETTDDLTEEAFAVVREASRRYTGLRHFDVQLLGGLVLHQGKIAEMKTGEGKTLVATLPLYLNALSGRGAHLITVNDYLAKRDAQWMGPIYDALGLSVSILQHDASFLYSAERVSDAENMEHLTPCTRREAYRADITYGTNHEFGFDYLRDNMAVDRDRVVHRELHYAIVDEVDNILIDEARTPLIISGPAQESTQTYTTFARLAPRLQEETDYTIDEKARSASLTEEGIAKMENWLGIDNLFSPENFRLTRYMDGALKAHALYRRDREYVVKDGQVVIVDEFTGRLMPGRRWSDGLHQSVEAKEKVKVQQESLTYATITLQNYFRLYDRLAGMTGTAVTEAEEFYKIYKLDVVVMPTNVPMAREDSTDLIYRNERAKFEAVAEEIEEMHEHQRPVLVGTVSIEKSEYLSELLKRHGVPHQVLNAKLHEKEAGIIADAGRPGAVTIATNMAGRGTDIVLGGKPDGNRSKEEWQREHDLVVEAGGLHIIGTERHEARRIDNQLRGRAGRQGDPGSSRFFVSLEDDVMRRFAPDWLGNMLGKLGMDEDTPLESKMVSKSIESAQTKVEGHNFDIRKHLVDYDDVMNTHRDVIYKERAKIFAEANLKSNILEMVHEEITELVELHVPERDEDLWNLETLFADVGAILKLPSSINVRTFEELDPDEILERLLTAAEEAYERREVEIGPEQMRTLERLLMLRTIDGLWVEHLTATDEMRQGIGLRAYGQADPLVAYKREAHDMWGQLLVNIRHQVARAIYHVELSRRPPQRAPVTAGAREPAAVAAGAGGGRPAGTGKARKIGRNQPCPCGSGKKYKKCHGMAA